jgi:hypothetical protein
MNRVPAVIALLLYLSCSAGPPSGRALPGSEDALAPLFPGIASDTSDDSEITARVRLDLPKYRIRGTCSVFRSADGSVQLDFVHSSLFGSVREEATVFIDGDSIAIEDHVRGTWRGSRETLALLREYFDFEVLPRDIMVMLLLSPPPVEEIRDLESSFSGGSWRLEGLWRGRLLEMQGDEAKGPEYARLCAADGKGCYEAKYGYDRNTGPGGYPGRIVCERKGGTERLSVTVESVKKNPRYLEQ